MLVNSLYMTILFYQLSIIYFHKSSCQKMSYLEIVKTYYKGKTQAVLKPICFLKLVSVTVSKFSFFSCSITHTSHSSSYRCGVQKASENKRRKRTSKSRNIFFQHLTYQHFISALQNYDLHLVKLIFVYVSSVGAHNTDSTE